jgi:hypothetical protein
VGAHQAEHALDVGEGLADLPVQHAEEVERDVELDQEGVDQHQVAEGHAPLATPRGAPHHRGDAHGDDRRLAHVEIRQGFLVGDLGGGPLGQLGVVAAGFEGFVVEVLHRLVVDQAVDGAGVGGGVEFVGLAAQGGAPVGDLEGEGDVERQRDG